jgi:hypothetical protein
MARCRTAPPQGFYIQIRRNRHSDAPNILIAGYCCCIESALRAFVRRWGLYQAWPRQSENAEKARDFRNTTEDCICPKDLRKKRGVRAETAGTPRTQVSVRMR